MLNAPQLNRFLEDLIHLQEFIVSNKELEDDVYYKGFFLSQASRASAVGG